ncbi:MAG TPA: helix-turn-helix domain-containing protein [Polyangiaceae bacterium]|jgi:excisionase family DNA binding protein
MRNQTKLKKARPLSAVPDAPSAAHVAPARSDARAPDAEMLTYQALAHRTGIRVSTLYAMVCRHEIPHYRLARRIVRFNAAEIGAWMAARRFVADPASDDE